MGQRWPRRSSQEVPSNPKKGRPELLYIKFASKDQTVILAPVLNGKSDFTKFFVGFSEDNKTSPDFLGLPRRP